MDTTSMSNGPQFDITWEMSPQARTLEGLTEWDLFLDSVCVSAWPFFVDGAICPVSSDNKRDPSLVNGRYQLPCRRHIFFRRTGGFQLHNVNNNRSVMPFHVLVRRRWNESISVPWARGPANQLSYLRASDWGEKLFPMNKQFPVEAYLYCVHALRYIFCLAETILQLVM